MNKTAASAAQLAKYIFTSCLFTYNCKCVRTNKNFIAYLTSWHNSIFGYKSRTDYEQLRLKILKVKNSEPQLRIYWFL